MRIRVVGVIAALSGCFSDGGAKFMDGATETSTGSTSGSTAGSSSSGGTETGGATSGGAATTTGGGTTSGATGTTGDGSSSTGPAGPCAQTVKLVLPVEDAALSGDWMLVESMTGEGTIAQLMGGVTGAVTWTVDVPCEDTWHVWARGFNLNTKDSLLAQVDGAPEPAAIFEVECTDDPATEWLWQELNRRDMTKCVYLEDPWAPAWTAGVHTISLSYRQNESESVGRMIVINDPDFVPGMSD